MNYIGNPYSSGKDFTMGAFWGGGVLVFITAKMEAHLRMSDLLLIFKVSLICEHFWPEVNTVLRFP